MLQMLHVATLMGVAVCIYIMGVLPVRIVSVSELKESTFVILLANFFQMFIVRFQKKRYICSDNTETLQEPKSEVTENERHNKNTSEVNGGGKTVISTLSAPKTAISIACGRTLLWMFFLLCATLTTVSCSDDDSEPSAYDRY